MTHRTLLRRVWGRRGSTDTARVRTAMKKLRKKLGDPAANPTYIFNRHGVGYSFGDPGAAWEAGRLMGKSQPQGCHATGLCY